MAVQKLVLASSYTVDAAGDGLQVVPVSSSPPQEPFPVILMAARI
ncbi:MAG: hypothetical protein WDO19_29040 [Bacteroidota bacterium]